MPFGSTPIDRLAIPDGTTVEEHDVVTEGDVVVGGQATVGFGIRGDSVIAGERVSIDGRVEAEGDCRLDMWCSVGADVLVGEDAYLGERVSVDGQLKVAGDLDIGDDVDIADGFEANGWIVIRNPMPTVVFLFVYLSHLLRIGEEEAAADVLESVTGEPSGPEPLLIPRGATVSDDRWRVPTPATVGSECRIHGNVRAQSVSVGAETVVFGSLRAKADVGVGRDATIKGDVTTRGGTVRVGPGVTVWGDVSADSVALHDDATVEGTIRARDEVTMHTDRVVVSPGEERDDTEVESDEPTGEGADTTGEHPDTAAGEAAAEERPSGPDEPLERPDPAD